LDQFGLGQVGLSSMYAISQVHDSDWQVGSEHEIWVGDIPSTTFGLWGQEDSLHHLSDGDSICLDTRTPTTHNTGSPTLCILWGSDTVTHTWNAELAPDHIHTAEPGDNIRYVHALTNTGKYTDTFAVTYESTQGWAELVGSDVITLGRDAISTVNVDVMVPGNAVSGTQDVTIITATSQAVGSVWAIATNTTTVSHIPGVMFVPNRSRCVVSSGVITYTHILTNTGNYTDTFDFNHNSNQDWLVTYTPSITLGHHQAYSVVIEIDIPDDTIYQVDKTIITATSRTDPNIFANVVDTTSYSKECLYLPLVCKSSVP
jgi:hypothetical protein